MPRRFGCPVAPVVPGNRRFVQTVWCPRPLDVLSQSSRCSWCRMGTDMSTRVGFEPQGSFRRQASVWRKVACLVSSFFTGMGTFAGATLLTSAFASVAWFITYVTDNVVATPAIEYSVTSEPIIHPKYKATVWLRNLSGGTISGLKVDLAPQTGSEVKFERDSDKVEFISPAYPGNERSRAFEDSVYYHVEHLQPGNEVKLSVVYHVSTQEPHHVEPKIYLSSEHPVRPMMTGWDTWIYSPSFHCSFHYLSALDYCGFILDF